MARMDLRTLVSRRLHRLNWTPAELARRSGVHPVTIWRWLSRSPKSTRPGLSYNNVERVLDAVRIGGREAADGN